MDILYLLIPLAILLALLIILGFLWAVKSGQFDDLEGPAHQILLDDDLPVHKRPQPSDSEQKGENKPNHQPDESSG